MSSVYEILCVSGCEKMGRSCMNRLKRVGESTDPCGTPLGWMMCRCGQCRHVYL